MNKKELATVVVLILFIPIWLYFIDPVFIKPYFPDPPAPVATAAPEGAETRPDAAPTGSPSDGSGSHAAASPTPSPEVSLPVVVEPDLEERTVELENEKVRLVFSNRGAGVVEAVMKLYSAELDEKGEEVEERVHLPFGREERIPALSYELAGLSGNSGFSIEPADDQNTVVFAREVMEGLTLRRTLALREGYVLDVTDEWINSTDLQIKVPEMTLALGPMYPREEISQKFGPYVGIDAHHTAGVGIKHYVKDLAKKTKDTADIYREEVDIGMDWFAVKNKFFTQVLTFENQDWIKPEALIMRAIRGEGDIKVGMAQASAKLGEVDLDPGQTMERIYTYYVGPVSMDNLKQLGNKQEEVIDYRLFRVFVPIAKTMMMGLNKLHDLTGNWGISIILLTFVVRMLFWPLTQKGAENMKRMSELSPQMKELREKHKSNPQKLNQEMSKFYKEHKVNPMAGCLPMVVQIPVFISLYGVLRVAVDLRFADFLWINDLSEQEALFSIAEFPVNILPLTMGATMVLQQKLTPSNMDEQQKKIMMMMPIVFLFITYTMPSGLLLYWTTSNLISIYQTTHTRRRDAKKAAAKGNADTPAPAKGGVATKGAKGKPASSGKKRKK